MEEPQQLSFRVSEEYEGPLDLILALISISQMFSLCLEIREIGRAHV